MPKRTRAAILPSVGKWLVFLAGIGLATRSCMPTYDSFGVGYDDAATVLFPIVFVVLLFLVIATHRWIDRARARDPSRSRWLFLLCLWPLSVSLLVEIRSLGMIGGAIAAALVIVLISAGLAMLLIGQTDHPRQETPAAAPVKTIDQREKDGANEGPQSGL